MSLFYVVTSLRKGGDVILLVVLVLIGVLADEDGTVGVMHHTVGDRTQKCAADGALEKTNNNNISARISTIRSP
jgi:hypothetical protein